MRPTACALIALALGSGLAVVAAGEAGAQARLTVPVIVRPTPAPAPPGPTSISVQGSATTGAVGGRGAGFRSVPGPGQEVHITIFGAPAPGGPSASGASPTQITIERGASSAGFGTPQPSPGYYGSVPAVESETHVIIRQDPAGGGPPVTREIRIQSSGPAVETPIVILPE